MRFRPGRPFRRLGPPLIPRIRRLAGPPLAAGPLRALSQAHSLFAAGRFGEAADLFENLANTARANGIPRAPRFFLQAARSNWHAGRAAHGMDLLRIGMDMLVAVGAIGILNQVVHLAINELNGLGLTQEAEQVRQYISKIPGWEEAPTPSPAGATARPTLPTHCTQCGGIVRPDEVDWIDEKTAECVYCGSPLRPEK